MSLLDDAKTAVSPRQFCKLAMEVRSKFSDDLVVEFVELMQSPDVSVGSKHDVLARNGIIISESTLRKKIFKGCHCEWCRANWMPDVTS